MIIGITGGIGSGKSMVTDHLRTKHSFITAKTDDLAADMMAHDDELINRLKKAFGPAIYLSDGALDKKRYASIIHTSEEKRQLSDSIVHPAVWDRVRIMIRKEINKNNEDFGFAVETALPGDTLKTICDEVWYIKVDEKIRIERLMKDRGYSEDYARCVIEGQISDKAYSEMADRILVNETTLEDLYSKVDRILINVNEINRK